MSPKTCNKSRSADSSKELVRVDPLTRYLNEVRRYPMLTLEEEQQLANAYHKNGDVTAARRLVEAHLRLVVKIAMEYRKAYYNTLDLIQEGSVGLMMAVTKFDPDNGARFSSYATWWIRSYILKFILDNFRLIKIGTTKEQKKLFYNLIREKQKMEAQGFKADKATLAKHLQVSEKAVEQMTRRLTTPEYSLEAPVGAEKEALLKDFIPIDDEPLDEQLATRETEDILKTKLAEFAKTLKPRDLEIFQQRLMADLPLTLQEIADDYGISKERVRQIETRILGQLKVYFEEQGLNADSLKVK